MVKRIQQKKISVVSEKFIDGQWEKEWIDIYFNALKCIDIWRGSLEKARVIRDERNGHKRQMVLLEE